MTALPDQVVALLYDRTNTEHRPAYLLLDEQGRVEVSGGLTDVYGLDSLRPGDYAGDTIPALQSCLPIATQGDMLRSVTMPSGRVVDLWASAEGKRTWVVLFDVSRRVREQKHFQQQANEAQLLAYREDAGAGELRALPAVLAVLGVAVLARHGDGSFGVIGTPPSWFAELWPGAPGAFRPAEHSPFLEHFLAEAEECWRGVGEPLRHSGMWTEVDGVGHERRLTAWAVRASEQPLLVINDATRTHESQTAVMQQARDQALVHSRLLKEIEKKDVLLHSIVHDLRSPMISVHSTLQLLALEESAARVQELVRASMGQLERQDRLIRTILDVFAADARGLDHAMDQTAVNLLASAEETITTFAPVFLLKQVEFVLTADEANARQWLVSADPMRLVRVLANLIENALRHSRRGHTVRVTLSVESTDYRVDVEDQGPGVPPTRAAQVFHRFAQGGASAGTAGLGLHFCRIMIEGWGGKIGQHNRDEGGSCFWFTLPQVADPDNA